MTNYRDDPQKKPFWVDRYTYGIRDVFGNIVCRSERPRYRGQFYMNGINTGYLDDPEGRFIPGPVYARYSNWQKRWLK
jgi:hypothetical protein